MSTRFPLVYLAGAIRDNHPEDISWREYVISAIQHKSVILNPLAGKSFNAADKQWTVSGVPSSASLIVKHDFWSVDRADVVIFNFTALAEQYPNIGTLVEFGRATANGALLYAVIDQDYKGHENTDMYDLHPFLAENCAVVFNSITDLVAFLSQHIEVLSGATPRFAGY